MRLKASLFGLVVSALLLSASGSAWATSDSVINKIQLHEVMKVGVSLFEPWTMCNTDGELIGYEIDLAKKLAEDIGVQRRICPDGF